MFHIASDDALPPLPASLSDAAKDFLTLCLVKNPSTRPSATELLQHPFVSVDEPATVTRDDGSLASFSSSSSPSPLTSDDEEGEVHSAEYSSSEEEEDEATCNDH